MIDTKISKKATNAELELAVKSQLAYSEWRAIDDDPKEHGFSDLRCLQIELIRWEVHNFGVQKQWTSTLGIFEELGELIEAIGEAQDEDVIDAIGDFMVYTVNLCTKVGLDFESIMDHANSLVGSMSGMDTLMAIWKAVGKLSHIILKAEQKIRGYDDRSVKRRDAAIVLGRLVAAVTELAFAADISAEATLFGVAHEVMKRDWVKYPLTGLPEQPTADLALVTEGVEVSRNGVPSLAFNSVPETGRWQDGEGVTHYVVDGSEVTEEVFEAQRR